jgi:hypothetical protein
MKRAIYAADEGTDSARPVRGVIEIPDEPRESLFLRLQDQLDLLATDERTVPLKDAATFSDLDNDASTYDFTVDARDWLLTGAWDGTARTATIHPTALWTIEGQWIGSVPTTGAPPAPFTDDAAYVAWVIDGRWTGAVSTTEVPVEYVGQAVDLDPIAVPRFSLEQRQAAVRRRRDTMLADALQLMAFDRRLNETDFGLVETYVSTLRAIGDAEANPDAVTFPALGAIAENASASLRVRTYRRDNILAAVGLSGGVPTGALIESAENANGLYVRLASGHQICFGMRKATFVNSTLLLTSWTFPAAFNTVENLWIGAFLSSVRPDGTSEGLALVDMETCVAIGTARGMTSANVQVRSRVYDFVSGDEVWLNVMSVGRFA